MTFSKFTNLDYDQIRESIKDYLRADSNFTGFDFEGSNFSILIDTLAYNAYINSVNANMIVNESFLDSATIRRNVTSLASNIGYLPNSIKAAIADISFRVEIGVTTPTLTLRSGLVAIGGENNTSYIFSIPENITVPVINGVAEFGNELQPIQIYQGNYATNTIVVDGSIEQRFVINNPNVDYSTLVVRVRNVNEVGSGGEWTRVNNIVNVNAFDEIYFLNEIENEKYEVIFGDGVFGKPVANGQVITFSYIVTNGEDGNGASKLSFSGSLESSSGATVFPTSAVPLNVLAPSKGGSAIESVTSIKYYAPKLYSSQYRAVTGNDYEAIIKEIYPNTESVSVVGGEELVPPRFGTVILSIKPMNGLSISEFDKSNIISALKGYAVAGINQEIVDVKVLFVEINTSVYYDDTVISNAESLKSDVSNSLSTYASSINLNRFGGRFKYSKSQKIIDDTSNAITSNITKVIIRRNLNALVNNVAQYELCYGNSFYYTAAGYNIKSSGFEVLGYNQTLYMADAPNLDERGNLDGSGLGRVFFFNIVTDGSDRMVNVVIPNAGSIDYTKGEIRIKPIQFVSTTVTGDVIEIQAIPLSNDVLGLKDLYVVFAVENSTINMVKDTITSGEQVSGVGFKVTSSYSNGKLTR
jgi:hypothetical protein